MNEKNVTNEELLATVKAGFAKMATKEDLNGVKEDLRDIRNDIEQLKAGAFSKDEKEEVLDMVKHYNQKLEDDVLGNKHITLLRSEYDDVAKTVGFENRFEKLGK